MKKMCTLTAVPLLCGLCLLAMAAVPAQASMTSHSGTNVSAALLGQEVQTALLHKMDAKALHINVDVSGSQATLTGTVPDKAALALAADLARNVDGIESVTNHLTVAMQSGGAMTDPNASIDVTNALLEARVKTQLLQKLGSRGLDIQVQASNRQVLLSGNLPVKYRDRAVKALTKVKGIDEIVDRIKS